MTVRILVGDVRERLRGLAAESVHCAMTSPPYWGLRSYLPDDHLNKAHELGSEKTYPEYIDNMLAVFREVWRVLRPDGSLWLNLGDCYHSGDRGGYHADWERGYKGGEMQLGNKGSLAAGLQPNRLPQKGLKKKDLVGMPWRVAFALQADGWYLRQDIIWHKLNPMPESVQDRPTKSHEYIFLLTKQERYFYDTMAIMEECSENTHSRGPDYHPANKTAEAGSGIKNNGSFSAATWGPVSRRNKRSVWSITTGPLGLSHYAAFPTALVRPCILAGTSERGVCPKCAKPWRRVVEKQAGSPPSHHGSTFTSGKTGAVHPNRGQGPRYVNVDTGNWLPSCKCAAGAPVPATVLDPFGGSGTTGLVADQLRRDAILIELNPQYAAMAKARIEADAPMFAEVSVEE